MSCPDGSTGSAIFISERQTSCPVQGNSDLYGLGIRLGIYVQMITVQISGVTSARAHIKVSDHMGEAALIFILSAGIVLAKLVSRAEIQPVEVAPILTLLVAHLGVCRVPWWQGQALILIYVAEVSLLVGLKIWFWWSGMETLPRSCANDYAFFFSKVSIWGWFRKLCKGGSLILGVSTLSGVAFYLSQFARLTRNSAVNSGLEEPASQGDQQTWAQRLASRIPVFDFLILGCVITFVEVTLVWNHISQIHSLSSPGQFMPFFISLAQLISTTIRSVQIGLNVYNSPGIAAQGQDDLNLQCRHRAADNDIELSVRPGEAQSGHLTVG